MHASNMLIDQLAVVLTEGLYGSFITTLSSANLYKFLLSLCALFYVGEDTRRSVGVFVPSFSS